MIEDTLGLPAFTDAPSEDESKSLTELGRELYAVDADIVATEKRVADLKERRKVLVMKELPDYLTKVSQDKIGLPEFGVDLVMENYYHANIQAEWPEEQRDAAFKYLEDGGNGDLIKITIEIAFSRKDYKKAAALAAKLEKEKFSPVLSKGVAWNTLTAFVKEQIEGGKTLDLDVLGATVGRIVKIKKRK